MSSEAASAMAIHAAPDQPLLTVTGLVKKFGSFHALDGMSLDVRPGEVLGLIGPNGSGKTTCINVITGLHPPDEGTVLYQGKPIGGLPSHRLARLGINRTFQVPKPFMSLTVRENVEVAQSYGRPAGGDSDGARPGDIKTLLERLELDRDVDRCAAELNSAQQKMLDLARALATRPQLLCVDELGAGLNPSELGRVAERLRELARSGIALLVVEHLMDFVDQVTDRLVVLSAGKNIFSGPLALAARDPQVVEVFLGSSDEH